MSDWYRSGRQNDQGRYGSEDRERRDFGGQDRWSEQERWRYGGGEGRSFDEPQGDQGYGDQGRSHDWTARGESYPSGRPQAYGSGQGYGSQSYGAGSRGYGAEGYRGSEPQERSGYGRQDQSFSGSDYGREEARGYGATQGGGAVGVNPALRRLSDGEMDHGLSDNMRMGEHRGRGPKNYTRSDERIREDVNDRLSDDSWLDASEVEVQVSKCEVTLTGTVQSREDKRRAEDLAEHVSGVKHVQNNLRVQPHSTQDSRQDSRQTASNAGGSGPAMT